ncbi:MAG: type II toxin-antitoxin system RelE/ParE family toxin [Actinobacteria bacterium]|nr:type II toxin-antitoxin system RelE/ParE family toxin [Actinomycetota bacterium]
MTGEPYEIVVSAPAARAIRETLPEAVAFSVIEFVTGPLRQNPRRVGAPLRGELEGIWSARRGTYRILYRIDEETREVVVLRVGHRRRIYQTYRTD